MAIPSIAAGAYASTQRLSVPSGAPGQKPGGSFAEALVNVVESVAQSGRGAEQQALSAVQGKADMVDVVTAVAESESALETLVAVRDKVIQAYEEIMRMPV